MGEVLCLAGDRTIRKGRKFCFWKFVCRHGRIKFFWPPRNFIKSNSWKTPSVNEVNWFASFTTVVSKCCSLTRMVNKYYLIRLRSFFAPLKPNKGKTLHIVPESPEEGVIDSFVSVRSELRYKCCYHNHLDSRETFSSATVDYGVGYVSPRCCPVYSQLLSRYWRKKVPFVLYFARPDLPVLQ